MQQPKPLLKTLRFKFTLHSVLLKITRSCPFTCKVQWKRHQAKAETAVVQHKDNQSKFDEQLVLEFSIQQDQMTKLYLPKNTDIMPVIVVDGGLKCGGFARFDLAEVLNSNSVKTEKEIKLSKCPDPNGSVKFTLEYENLGQVNPQVDQSVLEPSVTDIPLQPRSPTFGPNSQNKPIFQTKSSQTFNTNPNTEEVAQLKKVVESLQRRLVDARNKQEQFKVEKDKLNLQVLTLQRSLDKKCQELMEKSKELATAKAHNDFCTRSSKQLSEKDSQIAKLVEKVAGFQKQLSQRSTHEQINSSSDISRAKTQRHLPPSTLIKSLQQQKLQLQHQLASSNIKIANIFNIALQRGGPQLLDIIQSCLQ